MYNRNYGPLDRFCAKHPRFGIPNLMKIIVFAQIAVWVVELVLNFMDNSWLAWIDFSPYWIFRGQLWRLVTWLVVPNDSNPFYLLLGCYFYYWIGSMLERQWGTARFSLFYLTGALISVVFGLVLGLLQPDMSYWAMDLSYYLNLSIFLIIATMFGDMQVLLFFVIPIKVKWLAIIDVVLIVVGSAELFQLGAWAYALVPLASIVNYLIFTWPFWQMKLGIAKRRADPQVINFKKAQRKAEQTARSQSWHHKCSVCGITDESHPDMEFRYCSKCDGYHCYCADHIGNHIHIHEE